jgi:hypothetical protein
MFTSKRKQCKPFYNKGVNMYPFIDLNMSNKDYHLRSEISNSDISILKQSPALLQFAKLNKKKPTPAMVLGSLFHTLVLQPHLLNEEYVLEFKEQLMSEFKTEDGKTDKAAWEAYKFSRDNFKNNIGDKTIITVDQLATANAMKQSLMSNNTVCALLKDAIIESSAFWIDEDTGIPCRCRPDIAWPSNIICDLKTTDDASYNEFRRTIITWNYDVQAAHYLKGYSKASGRDYQTFVFIVCEKKPPYGIAIYAVNDAVVEAGGQLRGKILKKYSAWMNETNNKGIYPDEIQSIDMAAYGFNLDDR